MYSKMRFNKRWKNKVDGLLRKNFHYNEAGRLELTRIHGAPNSPWVFINHGGRKKFCGYWNEVYCGEFGLIPTHCRFSCWKVVVKPRTLKEVFQVYEKMLALNLPSKIGADLREYTYGPWAGFIYSDSLEQGREYWKRLREKVDEIDPDISVILKRGCTEMEQRTPSDKWDVISEQELRDEEQLNDLFHFTEDPHKLRQSEWQKYQIKEFWVYRAIAIGDPTAREMAIELSGNPDIWDKITVISKEYHETDPREIPGEIPEEKKDG